MQNTSSAIKRFVTFWLMAITVMLFFTVWLVVGFIKTAVSDGVLTEQSANFLLFIFGLIFSGIAIAMVMFWVKRDEIVKMEEMEQKIKIPRAVWIRTLWRATSVLLTNGVIFVMYHGLAAVSIGYAFFLMQSRPETYGELVNYPGGLAAVGMAIYFIGAISSETQRSFVRFRELYPIRLEDVRGIRKAAPSFKDKPLFNPDDKIIMLSRRKDQCSVGTVKRLATSPWDTVHRYDIEIESSTEPGINPGDIYFKCSELHLKPFEEFKS